MEFDYSGDDSFGLVRVPRSQAHGCDLDVSLVVDSKDLRFNCIVHAEAKDGTRLPPEHGSGPLYTAGEGIIIRSTGGRGAAGTDGRNGYRGADGADGRSATQYWPGQNGGDGGRGGDGTPGTNGGPGGFGGDITIRVREEDTDALALLRIDNRGGAGGPPGKHGQGGAGGRGGRGGSSYSWNETYQETVVRYRQVTRYENGGTVYTQEPYTDYETRYRSRYQPGGSSGYDGAPGYTPNSPLFPGRDGEDGSLTILVETDEGTVSYPGLYKLTLGGFRASVGADNGIFEPGDTITISDIEVVNDGAMPTPRGQRIKIAVSPNAWSETESVELHLTESIPPGGSLVIPGRLMLTIKEMTGEQLQAYRESKALDLRAEACRFSQKLRSFTLPQEILLSHPIETTEVSYVESLLQGEVARVSLRVSNNSEKALGIDGDESAIRRGIKLRFEEQWHREHSARLVFCEKDGTPTAVPILEREIGYLKPGESCEVITYVTLAATDLARRAHFLHGNLLLEKIGTTQDFKCIQTSNIEFKEGIPYQPNSQAAFLLVINSKTTEAEIEAWKGVAQTLHLPFSVWDMGVHPYLPMTDYSPAAQSNALAAEWQKKLIVVLNRGSDGASSDILTPLDYLSRQDLNIAMRIHDLRFYIVGEPYPSAERPSISPIPRRDSEVKLATYADLRKALRTIVAPNLDFELPIARTTFKASAGDSRAYLEQQVLKVRESLARDFPTERFHVSAQSSPEPERRIAFLPVFQQRLGSIIVRREEGPRDALLMGASVDAKTMSDPRFVGSDMNKILLLAAMPKEQLVDVVMRALTEKERADGTEDIVTNAVAYRVAAELGKARAFGREWGIGQSAFLRHLCDRFIAETSTDRKPLLSLCAGITSKVGHFISLSQPWYSRLCGMGRQHQAVVSIVDGVRDFERHLKEISNRREYAEYKRAVWRNVDTLRTSPATKELKAFLGTIVGEGSPATSATQGAWFINPYFTDSVAKEVEHDARERTIRGEIIRRAAAREAWVIRPSTAPRGEA